MVDKIPFNSGGDSSLGVIIAPAFSGFRPFNYQLTWNDLLWIIRMAEGEAGERPSAHVVAVMWCYAVNRLYVQKHTLNPSASPPKTLIDVIQKSSQPINPIWKRDGFKCKVGGTFHNSDDCSPAKLDRRDAISGKMWDDFTAEFQNLVVDWAHAKVPNNVERAADFAIPPVGASYEDPHTHSRIHGQAALDARGFEIIWDSESTPPRPADSTDRHGNVFYSNRASRNWPDNFLRIQMRDGTTTSTTQPGTFSSPSSPQSTNSAAQSKPDSEPTERIQAMTHGRTFPPTDPPYDYFVLKPHGNNDPQIRESNILEIDDSKIQSPYDRFFDQMLALKNVSNLDMTKTIPVIEIKTIDGSDHINLTELIFSQNVKHGPDPIFSNQLFPELPLASIDSLMFTVQPPGTGTAVMVIGTLKIKIHNASTVNTKHPRGKYLSYMMKQGYHLRIKYGVSCPDPAKQQAFRTMEEDFFISTCLLKVNNDQTIDATFTLIPEYIKLFNTLLIGESVPISQITNDGQLLSVNDVRSAIESSISSDATPEQRQTLQTSLENFVRVFNSPELAVGFRLRAGQDQTIGSLLHGAISQSSIMEKGEHSSPVIIDSMIGALRSIQGLLLSKRYNSLLNANSYLFNLKGVPIVAANTGPIIYTMVKPEIDNIVGVMAQNQGLTIGQVDSVDGAGSLTGNRTGVKFIFGNFNDDAGQWSGKPISAFPINIENIFNQLREQRDVGRFGDTVTNFMSNLNRAIGEDSNYDIPDSTLPASSTPGEETQRQQHLRRFESPDIKYVFYPNPMNLHEWIFYVYDAKERTVRFRNVQEQLNSSADQLTEAKIIDICRNQKIPWLKMGEGGSTIRTMSAETGADDLIATANILGANAAQMHQRRVDQPDILNGISRDFLTSGNTQTNQQVVQAARQILPLKLQVDHFMATTAQLFYPVYIIFPIKEFSGIYVAYSLGHQFENGRASTKFDFQIQITTMNYRD